LKKELLQLLESSIDTKQYFIVEIIIGKLRNTTLVKIKIDSDKGIGIDECAEISRFINQKIEDSQLVEDYELEVTSPGVGEPLKLNRQYLKNIGRMVKVLTNEGKEVEGKMLEASGEKVVIEQQIKLKHKVIDTKLVEIPFLNIKKTIVLVSFN
jgi:ribosome maturation factor RimP